MVRKMLVIGAVLFAFSSCGGDDGDDTSSAASGDSEVDVTDEPGPTSDDDDASADEGDDEPEGATAGAAGPSCYEPIGSIGPSGPDAFEPESTVMGNVAVDEVVAELESVLDGIDGIACPEFPEGLGFGYANSLTEFGDDDVVIDSESDLYLSIDGDSDDPAEHADALMTLCEELSSFLAEHDGAVGTARIEIDFGVDPGYDYEPAVLNESVTPGDPGTCTAA